MAILCLAICANAIASEQAAPTVKSDKKFGSCWGADIMSDYFKRFPPVGAKFSLEIDIDRKAHEIYVYYHDMPEYAGQVSYYDSETCEYLRTEQIDANFDGVGA